MKIGTSLMILTKSLFVNQYARNTELRFRICTTICPTLYIFHGKLKILTPNYLLKIKYYIHIMF